MNFFEDEINKVKEQGLYRSLRTLSSAQGPEIEINGKKVLNFCSNNYLGLANDPRLNAAAIQAIERFGSGSGAARLISGNLELMEILESELAEFKGAEAALLFNSGYHANIGVIPALAGEGDVIFSDELNHASLIDGCRLSKAEKHVFRHNDLGHLEELLKTSSPPNPLSSLSKRGGRWIVTEAIFSMEGDLCPLEDLLKLAEKYDAMVYLDEAHAMGILGKNGEGLAPSDFPPNLVSMGTFGKAFGSYGAFVVSSKSVKEFLINKARSFIFSTALPPAVIAASREALRIIQNEPDRRESLWKNIEYLNDHLPSISSPSPIFSIKIGSAEETMKISNRLLEEGIYLQGIRPPTVPEGTSRLRLTLMATHSEAQIKKMTSWIKNYATFSENGDKEG